MPELPEVETTVKALRKTQPPILGAGFVDVWTDVKNFAKLKKQLKGKKIKKVWRRGKNIIFELSQSYSLLIHQKLTGHLLIGHWKLKNGNWEPLNSGLLEESVNRYIHLMFWLSGDLMLALSDLRKFAKVEIWKTKDLKKELSFLGLEPLDKNFTFEKFRERIKKRNKKIKQILMDQETIAGIGNIYSDEILWRAKVHPFKQGTKLTEKELKNLYKYIKLILKKAIELRGESISDYRDPAGRKGRFDKIRKVYRREGEECSRCGTKIKRAKLGSRSTYFCPLCQKNF